MNDEPVLYSYRCVACGRRGSMHLVGDDHEGETVPGQSCGAPVTLEWDGGVTLDGLPKSWSSGFGAYSQSILREEIGADYAYESIRRIQRMGDRSLSDNHRSAETFPLWRSDQP
ncbi:hypothetical protein B0G84_7833 [Paraburkholderia sp. BL8N3]|nr:hypothetical protein [Paraburkholderia sp. BL8N3]TCK33564.1 hypothetical protein B0G84_7833 [Paraburkholderia sp. BL8N3]